MIGNLRFQYAQPKSEELVCQVVTGEGKAAMAAFPSCTYAFCGKLLR